jgi:peptidoglycan hydrolase-like amidase
MLKPNSIPASEPEINVGIILPGDNITKLVLGLPESPQYNLQIDGKIIEVQQGHVLELFFEKNRLQIKSGKNNFQAVHEIKISTQEHVVPQKQSGIKVSSVIAGRGFHWQKYIDVFLPDNLIFRVFEDRLILINQLLLEHYVMCVATSEMGAACPAALIEAQTIAARSFLLANVEQKHHSMEMDICNDDCCQRYQGTTFLTKQSISGALNSSGQVLIYKNKICDARYSKSCGGMMETFGNVWPGHEEDYLQAIPDAKSNLAGLQTPLNKEENFQNWVNAIPETFCSPHIIPETDLKKYLGSVDEEGAYFRWEISVSQQELLENIINFTTLEATAITKLNITKRGLSGRATKLDIHYSDKKGQPKIYHVDSEYNTRRYLAKQFLYSSAIIIRPENLIDKIPQKFTFIGAGWGHGVGLCQIGALGMSVKGYSTSDIVYHYYPGSTLSKIY